MKKILQILLTVVIIILLFSIISGGVFLLWRTAANQEIPFGQQIQSWFESFKQSDFKFHNNYTIDETKGLDLEGVRVIELKAVAERVEIITTYDSGSVRLQGQYRSLKPIQWLVERTGDRLTITARSPRVGLFHDLTFFLQLPESYTGAIEASSVSGQILLPGDMTAQESIDLSTISGSIVTRKLAAESIRLKSVSGSLIVSAIESDLVIFDTISGSVFLDRISASVDGKTTSGSIQLNYDQFVETDIQSVSGSIEIAVRPETNMNISFSSVSGSFSNKGLNIQINEQSNRSFNGSMGSGGQTLTIKTTSGSLLMDMQ